MFPEEIKNAVRVPSLSGPWNIFLYHVAEKQRQIKQASQEGGWDTKQKQKSTTTNTQTPQQTAINCKHDL